MNTQTADELAVALNEIGMANGLDRMGVCGAQVFEETRVELHSRKARGLHADMQFTYRNPDRATDPSRSLSGARSIVVGARSYRRSAPPAGTGGARIAEYVWEPHYEVLRQALMAVADHLKRQGFRARVLVDDNALVDRAAAHRAGIGWWGKNSNLLVPGHGSRFALGSVLTDAVIAGADDPIGDACGPCRRCIENCPTDAIVADGVIDARRCLAWLVQSAGVFPRDFREALGDRIYGCDDCQSTCPPNVALDRKSPPDPTSGTATVDVIEMLSLDDEALLERFGAWYIPRREPRYLRRNALIVLANIADPREDSTRVIVERYVASTDEIERAHAVWAAHRLGYDALVDSVADDEQDVVRDEFLAATASR